MADIPGLSGPIDYHKAITKKERSSRYIRTAFDYLVQVQGEDALNELLREVGIERDSSIFKHIYDDENWNSYELEVFLYEKLKDRFEDPYQAIWQFGIASGSGRLDQKDTLFAFKLKIAPVPVILRKVSEHTERVTLVRNATQRFSKPLQRILRTEWPPPYLLSTAAFLKIFNILPGLQWSPAMPLYTQPCATVKVSIST